MKKLMINEDGSNSFTIKGEPVKFNTLSYKYIDNTQKYANVILDGVQYEKVKVEKKNLEKFKMTDRELLDYQEKESFNNQVVSPTKVKITRIEKSD